MTKLEFTLLCEEYLVAPEVALENQSVRDALADRDDKRVNELLINEF
jgi:hypothetical protein